MKPISHAPQWSLFAAAFLMLLSPQAALANPEAATPADTFADSIGINTHIGYPDYLSSASTDPTSAPTVAFQRLNNALFLSRIRHIRDGLPLPLLVGMADYPTQTAELNYLASNGVDTDMVFSNQFAMDQPTQEQDMLELIAPVASAMRWAEGKNEPDNERFVFNNDTTWYQSAIDFQNVLNSAIKNSQFSRTPVIAPSIGAPFNVISPNITDTSVMQGMEYVSDFGNTHSYLAGSNPGTTGTIGVSPNPDYNVCLLNPDNSYLPYPSGQNAYLPAAHLETMNKPVLATETGYWVGSQSDRAHSSNWQPPVTLKAQEKYTARTYAEFFRDGILDTFLYELKCEQSQGDAAEHNFGILNTDWTERPAFTALKNLTALVGDPGPGFTPGWLNYTLSGATAQANVHHLLLQKRDGSFYLVLWQEVRSYDNASTLTDIPVSPVPVTLTLNTSIAHAAVYTPSLGPGAHATYTNPTSILLEVPDDLMVVQLSPPAATQPDLIVTGVGYTGNATPGTPVKFTCTIENIGPVATPAGQNNLVAVGFYKQGSASPLSWGSISGTLGPGQTANITADFPVTLPAGNCGIVSWVNDVSRFPESNQNNNQMLNVFTIK